MAERPVQYGNGPMAERLVQQRTNDREQLVQQWTNGRATLIQQWTNARARLIQQWTNTVDGMTVQKVTLRNSSCISHP